MKSNTLFGILLILFSGSIVHAAPPFVAGFDRFSKSESVSESVLRDVLLTELSCTACHQVNSSTVNAKGGPNLQSVGIRVNEEWLKSYLESPHKIKPGTTMPDVLGHLAFKEKAEAVDALSAFLSTQRKPFPEIRASGANPVPHQFWNKGSVERGRELYHSVGCVACHEPDEEHAVDVRETALDRLIRDLDPEELQELGLSNAAQPVNSIPHGNLRAKYSRESLTHFLLNPELSRPAGRMPSLKLQTMEAADIATYLLRSKIESMSMAPSKDEKLINRGRELFVSLRCANCHEVAEKLKPESASPLDSLRADAESNCIGNPKDDLPRYDLDNAQKKVLSLLLSAKNEETKNDPLVAMLLMNCFACHERDGLGGVGRKRQSYFETVGNVDIGDEGRLPPSLSHVGFKLKTEWMKKVLAGTGDIRPHLTIRMPKYPASQIQQLPKQFADADRNELHAAENEHLQSEKLVESGRQLLNTGCVQCHPIRGESLPGVVGTDLSGVTSRVHPAWFQAFLKNPIELKSRTRMPTFFPNGVSSNPAILDGNVDQQIAAIWSYLKVADKAELPEKILTARSQNYELVPHDKPIIIRTFMEKAGTHAIAVGFPERMSFAFDAERVEFAEAWKGKFLDAHGTWFNRFAPPAEPLGTNRIDLRSTFRLVLIPIDADNVSSKQIDEARRFLGYEIDGDGIPTFRYRIGSYEIADRFFPTAQGTLKRRFNVHRNGKDSESTVAVEFPSSVHSNNRFVFKEPKLQISVPEETFEAWRETITVGSKRLEKLYRLPAMQEFDFEVEYKW